ncbi:MAG TPA: hypothetical protein ENI90_02360 [Methylothermaceae bacterium]|nr:hypothetical protein [Methylothermaceae bacterium]
MSQESNENNHERQEQGQPQTLETEMTQETAEAQAEERTEAQRREAAEKLQASVREAVETAEDVREAVRRLTVEALAEGRLDAAEIRSVVEAVVEGASAGIEKHGTRARQALEEVLRGLEDGLIKAAEASKLALEEAASRAQEFAEQDVKRAFDQLVEMEKVYIDTLTEVARKGSEQSRAILSDLAHHARNSGTAIGEYMAEVMETLPRKLQEAGEWGLKAGIESARTAGAQLAAIASGFLAGISEALDRQAKKLRQEKSD